MYAVVLILHLFVCLGLVSVVLLQSGKGGGLAGGAFGGSAQTVFGGRGATDFMTRATMVLGTAFFLTSLALALLSSGQGPAGRSVIQEQAKRASSTATSPPGSEPPPPAPGGSRPATGLTPAPSTAAPTLPNTSAPPPAPKTPGGK